MTRSITFVTRSVLAVLVLLVTSTVMYGQEAQVSQEVDSVRQARIAALDDIVASMRSIQAEITEKEQEYLEAETEEQRTAVDAEIQQLAERAKTLDTDFTIVATGIDPSLFFERSEEDFVWQDELKEVVAPILSQLRQVTAGPREFEKLRAEKAYYEDRILNIDEAIEQLSVLQDGTSEPALADQISERLAFWEQQRSEFESRFNSVQVQMDKKEQEKRSVAEVTQEVFSIFFKKRGKNLLLALLAFFGIFLILRFAHRWIQAHSRIHKSRSRQFIVRVIDFVYFLFTIFAAITMGLVVLYISSDWLLLVLAIMFLLGLGWTAIKALPDFLEQAKLLLNIGPVREDERVIYKEIPWIVSSLNVYTDLRNPALKGGAVRLPLRDLIGLRSRPFDESEEWFPSKEGDWVILKDGFYGKVVIQTPDIVTIATRRGSHKSYPTVDFLHEHPMNLTRNTFVVNKTLRISYRHRDILNQDISSKLKVYMREEIEKVWYGEYLIEVRAELKEISESSLDMVLILKFTGEPSSEYFEIGWHLQQIALDACNKYGWGIPFPQLTIHQPDSDLPLDHAHDRASAA